VRILLVLVAAIALGGCETLREFVAVDVRTVDKPYPVPCRVAMPPAPPAHVALVQLTGDDAVDQVLIWRAAEAELEAYRAWRLKVEAAVLACMGEAKLDER